MKLLKINANRYRQRLNKIIFTSIATLTIGSLSISQLLILLMPSAQGSHFHWNLLGFVSTVVTLAILLSKLKKHPYFYEVSYVWDLKQTLNKINRRIITIEKASQTGDTIAMQILHFSYTGSRQLWELDNNTLTINHLTHLENKLQNLVEKYNVILDINQYDNQQLAHY